MNEKPLDIGELDGYQFEELVAKIMKRRGYQNIKVTQKSKDTGKDILMNDLNGDIIVVECKHQKFVGRPIVQKLQGAMNHEEACHQNKRIKGIIVTSGKFSDEAIVYNREINQRIEFVDGKSLKNICKQLGVHILNGKVQIVINSSFQNLSDEESKQMSLKEYSQIYGNELNNPFVKTEVKFHPACYLEYNVNFDTHTSIGRIDKYSNSGSKVIDGVNGKELDDSIQSFFFSKPLHKEEIKEESSKIQFEFTENDIEQKVVETLIREHTHNVKYMGKNNVLYNKTCVPKKSNINLKTFFSIYMPLWTNNIKIKEMDYKQNFYVKGTQKLFMHDEFRMCKICSSSHESYSDMNLCPECGRIVCNSHVKIDFLDEKTPICTIHAKPLKLYIQKKYFAYENNLFEYKKWWKSQGFLVRLWEDKIASCLSIGITLLLLVSLLFLLM